MKVRVMFFATFLVFNNVGIANQEVPIQKTSYIIVKANKREQKNIQEDLINNLIDRGIENDAAYSLVEDKTKILNKTISHLEILLKDHSYDEIIDVLATRILYKRSIDLSSKNTLIAVSQTIKGFNIPTEISEKNSKVA